MKATPVKFEEIQVGDYLLFDGHSLWKVECIEKSFLGLCSIFDSNHYHKTYRKSFNNRYVHKVEVV